MIELINISTLSRMLVKGVVKVIKNKDKINAINVYPIADSDTGSNLANTLLGIKQILENKISDSGHASLARMTGFKFLDEIIKSAFENSQGNSGIMMASYLKGFLESFENTNKIMISDFAKAAKNGEDAARKSVSSPVGGTMLDVMAAFSMFLECYAEFISASQKDGILKQVQDDNINNIFYKTAKKVENALFKTENKLKVLKDNHVVDAGALGFTYFVFGLYEGLSNKKLDLKFLNIKPKIKIEDSQLSHEVVFVIQKTSFSSIEIREMLNPLGESLDIIEIEEKIKIHIHTNKPDEVRETASLAGEVREIRVEMLK